MSKARMQKALGHPRARSLLWADQMYILQEGLVRLEAVMRAHRCGCSEQMMGVGLEELSASLKRCS